jgi:DNA topoisomerase III
MVFSSVAGHLLELEFKPPYNKWSGCSPSDLYTAPVEKRAPQGENQNIKRNLQNLARTCQKLILWLDCDREGENIAFEVIQVCREVNPNIHILRARFSALIAVDLYRAMSNLQPPNANDAMAVDARQEIDLRIGASFTRLQTLMLQNRFDWSTHPATPAEKKSPLLSYGPCQFPTLGLIVQREWEIQAHIPENFWYLHLVYNDNNNNMNQGRGRGRACVFTWSRDRLYDQAISQAYYNTCVPGGDQQQQPSQAKVVSVRGNRKTRWAPCPLSTLEMQKRGTQYLRGLSGEQIMKLAEELYQAGYISYPRTETDMFSTDYNLQGFVETQADSGAAWSAFAQRLLANANNNNNGGGGLFRWPRSGGHDDKAHPPIHPIKQFPGDNNPNKARLYEFIVRHFLACCSQDAVGQETKVIVDVNGETFQATGLMVTERNWLDVYPYTNWGGAEELPPFQEGQVFNPSELRLKQGATEPPPRMAERDLLAKMESFGIGTDATVADHIAKQLDRGYVAKEALPSGISYFYPTPLGEALISAYRKMGLSNLWQPKLRGVIEGNITAIARGIRSKEEVLSEAIQAFQADFMSAQQQAATLVNEVANIVFPGGGHGPQNNNNNNNNGGGPDGGNGGRGGQPFAKCRCGADLMLVRHDDNGPPSITCSSFPLCKNNIDLPTCTTSVEISDAVCTQCSTPSITAGGNIDNNSYDISRKLHFRFNPRLMPPRGIAPEMTACVLCSRELKSLIEMAGQHRRNHYNGNGDVNNRDQGGGGGRGRGGRRARGGRRGGR